MVSAEAARHGRIPCPDDYAVAVVIPTRKDEGETADAWAAAAHRAIEVYLTINPQRFDTPADRLAAYRWGVGILGRLAALVHAALVHGDMWDEAGHRCSSDPYWTCGLCMSEWLDHPEWASGKEPPFIEFRVPTPQVKTWAERIEHGLAQLLANDQQQPTAPQHQPGTLTSHQPGTLAHPAPTHGDVST